MGYIVTYKQGRTPYHTEPYVNYELANERAEVLRLLTSDLKIEDIQIKIVYF